MPTIADVAVRAGVSVATAGRVLSGNGYAGRDTRAKVLLAAEELGYVPNQAARSLRQGRTRLVGLLIADMENPFYSMIAKNVEYALKSAGYHLVLCNDNDDRDEERENLLILERMGVDGLIVVPTGRNRTELERLQEKGIQIVQIDRYVPGLRCDGVVAENERVSAAAVSHLIESGHTSIGVLAGPSHLTTAKQRLLGYERALREHGIPFRPELVRTGSFTHDHAVADATELLGASPRPTAIFATNNVLAEACVTALRERGLSIPSQMSLLAFDDLPWMSLTHPPLSTVRQPVAEMARMAAELVVQRIESNAGRPNRMTFTAELVLRGSTAPPRA